MAYGGIQFHVSGWSGSITITEGIGASTITPAATSSPWQVADALVQAANADLLSDYSWSVADSGALTLQSTGTFDLAMSATIQSLFDFAAASYSSISSVTTDGPAVGGFFPYSDGDGVLFTRRVRAPINQGFELYEGGRWLNTPGTNPKFPILSVSCLRSKVAEFMETIQNLGTPSKVDLYSSGSLVSCFLGSISINEQDPTSGWTRIGIEVIEL